MHRRSGVDNSSRSSGLRFDAGTHLFSEGEKNAALFFSLNFRTLLASLPRCFTGTLLLPLCLFLRPILKFWSIGVTLMRFTWANVSERRILVSNFSVTYNRAFVNFTHRIGFRMSELFRKIDEDFAGSIPEIRNHNCRVLFNIRSLSTALLSPFF